MQCWVGIVLGSVLVAVRMVLGILVGSLGAVLAGCCLGLYGFVLVTKVASVLERRRLDNEREHEVAVLICCRCALKSKMVSGVNAGMIQSVQNCIIDVCFVPLTPCLASVRDAKSIQR